MKEKLIKIRDGILGSLFLFAFYGVLFLLFKGCSSLLSPSEKEREKLDFRTELKQSHTLQSELIRHCNESGAIYYNLDNGDKIECSEAKLIVYQVYRKDAAEDEQLELLVEQRKNEWVKTVAMHDVSSPSVIGTFLTATEKNVHHCIAIFRTLNGKKVDNRSNEACISLMDICIDADVSPKNRTMTSMRFPLKWVKWRSQHEKTLQRRTNYQGHQRT